MFRNHIPSPGFLEWKNRCRLFGLQIVLLLFIFLLSGCVKGSNRTQSNQLYENPESGISLEKKANWDLEFYERSGLILLETENGFLQRNSSRLEIYENACDLGTTWLNRPDEELAADIERIQSLYNLTSVTFVQEPMKVEIGDNEAIRTIIAIPTTAMVNDTNRIQVEDHGPDTLQTIDIYAISDQGITIFAYIYEGDDDALNQQAREIVDSIQFICTPEP